MRRQRGNQPDAPQSSLLSPEQAPQAAVKESPAAAAKPLALVEDKPRALPAATEVPAGRNPMDMLLNAIQNPDLDMAKLEKLLQLQREWTAELARKAYIQAMVRFKKTVPAIVKNRKAKIAGKNGADGFAYEFADLPAVLATVIPALADEGFTHDWKMKQADGIMTVTCILRHIDGHTESTEMFALYDATGGKNAIQAIASAKTYLERYTVLAITGLSTASAEDDDGKSTDKNPGLQPISAEKVQEIRDKLETMDGGAERGLLDYLRVESIEEIPLQGYELAIDALARRKKARGG